MKIPAICDECGAIFPSGFSAENALNLTFANNKSGPCPKCGAMGHLPDGTFNFVNDTIELLQGPDRTVSELKKLQAILLDSRKKAANSDEIKQVLRDQAGELKSIADLLPKNRGDLYAFIAIILMVLEIILSFQKQEIIQQNVVININNVIERIYANTSSQQK